VKEIGEGNWKKIKENDDTLKNRTQVRTYIYIYIYIQRGEREREREMDLKDQRHACPCETLLICC